MKKIGLLTLFVLANMVYCECMAQTAVTFWKDGVPTIIYAPDSIFFWNADTYSPVGDYEGDAEEPTETEQMIMELTSDEELAAQVNYSQEDSIKYDNLAQEVLALFANENATARQMSPKRASSEDDLAQEAIRNNGRNIFENQGLIIEQQDWNSGLWGKTRYGGFDTYYNTYLENGKRYLLVVFYFKGGFPNKRTAYIKLGQVNSGKILGKATISTGREYSFLTVCIDDYLKSYGCVNFFPLLINEESKARNYLNPIFVKSDPIVSSDWRDKEYGYEFGKINGVSVYFNKDSNKGNTNQGDGRYQCVELCKRYVKELNPNIDRKLSDKWGNAINWPSERANDGMDPGDYIVYANDGSAKVREGDLIVWHYGSYGHIGVVIKTTETYISVAHQNGGTGKNALPIGSTLKIENGIVKDIKPGSDQSPIFATSKPIYYFIRMYNSAEDVVSYTATMTASTTNMAFGEVEAGKSTKQTFTVTNKGYATLTISSMTPSKGEAFSVDASNCTIEHGETRTFTVTFAPTKTGEYKDRIIIKSDAEDNPQWFIHLTGTGYGDGASSEIPTDGLVAYYPFNGNANDESGNGNDGTIIGNVELTTDRFGNSNSAYRFFGEPLNYISVPDNETLHLSTFTLNAWVYTDSEDYGNGYLINKGRDIENGSYRLCVRSVGATTRYGGSNDAYIDENPSVGSWHMITGTVEGDKAKYYLDGILKDERTLSTPFSYSNSDPLTLGMHYYYYVLSYWAYPLKGVLDDVRIYNRVLSSQEIAALAQGYFSNDGAIQGGAGGGSDPDVVPPTPGDDEGM